MLCLFDDADRETQRLPLPRTGRRGLVTAASRASHAGTRYGLRAYGPWDPANGMRFNPAKLLVDPWATAIDRPFRLHPALFDRDAPNPEDTAPLMPKAIVGAPDRRAVADRPDFDWDRQVIYELHVRGFSMTNPAIPEALRGTYAGLGHPASIAHLLRLGVTTVEIMPSAAWVDERHLPALNLTELLGLQPDRLPRPRSAPRTRRLGGDQSGGRRAAGCRPRGGAGRRAEPFRRERRARPHPVAARPGQCRLLPPRAEPVALCERRRLRQRAGAGPAGGAAPGNGRAAGLGDVRRVRRLPPRPGNDAGRGPNGFDPAGPFLAAMEQDPLLSRLAIIAEPWDIGSGGYQLGAFPPRWGEWNDRYRDTVRRFWRGDAGMLGEFTTRFAGSADIFPHRPLTRSINFITAHDGFTLADLVAYESKHNAANGENNRDGTDDNLSWNNGAEGPSDDPAVQARRGRDVRALLATLLLSRGTPMLTMGDEAGRTQHGNNNAYAQDNAGSWFDWDSADQALIDETATLITIRKALAPLFTGVPLTGGDPSEPSATPVVTWRHADGSTLTDWDRPDARTLIADLRAGGVHALIVFHAGQEPLDLTLPPAGNGLTWHALFSADGPTIQGRSVAVFQATAQDIGDKPRRAGVTDQRTRTARRSGGNRAGLVGRRGPAPRRPRGHETGVAHCHAPAGPHPIRLGRQPRAARSRTGQLLAPYGTGTPRRADHSGPGLATAELGDAAAGGRHRGPLSSGWRDAPSAAAAGGAAHPVRG